jgi:hypothetical protein
MNALRMTDFLSGDPELSRMGMQGVHALVRGLRGHALALRARLESTNGAWQRHRTIPPAATHG